MKNSLLFFCFVIIILVIAQVHRSSSETTAAFLDHQPIRQDELEIQCLFHGIKLTLSNETVTRTEENSYFFITQTLDEVYPVCFIPSESLQLFIPFPFRLCDTKPRLHGDNVTFYNSIWMYEGIEVTKFADFSCTYHKSLALSQDVQEINVESLPHNDTHENVSVNLCRSPFYCPRECATHYKIQNEAIYFDKYIFHLALQVESSIEESKEQVIAIDRLQLHCESMDNSPLIYNSVIDGCQARNWKKYFPVDSNTVSTSIDYNAAAMTVCMSVDTPPPKLCPKFFVIGSLIYCNSSSIKMCEDISGMHCRSESEQSTFSVGPLYVFPSSKGQSQITYYFQSGSTTVATITTELTTVAEETVVTTSIQEPKPEPDYDVFDLIEPVSKKPKVKNRKPKKKAKVVKTKLKLEDPILPQTNSTKKNLTKLDKIESKNVKFDVGNSSVDDEIISSRGDEENIRGKEKTLNGINNYPNKVSFENKVDFPELDKNPELDRNLFDVPKPKASVDEKNRLPLGKYKTSDGNRIFMWSLVASLGLFLFLSIGLLVAWMCIRSKPVRQRRLIRGY